MRYLLVVVLIVGLALGAYFLFFQAGQQTEMNEKQVETSDEAANGSEGSPVGETDLAEEESVEKEQTQDANTVSPPLEDMEDIPPASATAQFSTDFSKHLVPYDEILSGGPPKDGIPAIDEPVFIPVEEADEWLHPQESVILLQIGEQARAYPVQILIYHEIVNDELNGKFVSITYCPLCNTAIAFDREFDGQVLDFGTTGYLRYSNLVMYDRQTETWWQQGTGKAIAGSYTGSRLEFVPVSIIAWEDFRIGFPDGEVLSRDTGHNRAYGTNPYVRYDDPENSPFLYDGPQIPEVLPAMTRVLTIESEDEAVAYPYPELRKAYVVHDEIGGEPVVIFWGSATTSPLDAGLVSGGELVGSATAFSPVLNGQMLNFKHSDGQIIDEQTGSVWNILGQAISGDLAGETLDPRVSINHFWFSWAAFRPDTRIYQFDIDD